MHDVKNASLAMMLADIPDVVALGVIYHNDGPVYDDSVAIQEKMALDRSGPGDLNALLHSGHTWKVD
ncbi:MAG: hypothetical protein R3A47_02805 [Polyangiales bacterium]